jgi:hypothetical protein
MLVLSRKEEPLRGPSIDQCLREVDGICRAALCLGAAVINQTDARKTFVFKELTTARGNLHSGQ